MYGTILLVYKFTSSQDIIGRFLEKIIIIIHFLKVVYIYIYMSKGNIYSYIYTHFNLLLNNYE